MSPPPRLARSEGLKDSNLAQRTVPAGCAGEGGVGASVSPHPSEESSVSPNIPNSVVDPQAPSVLKKPYLP